MAEDSAPNSLEELEALAGGVTSAHGMPASEPRTDAEAVRWWAEARGLGRGRTGGPPMSVLRLAYERHAEAAGWARWYLPRRTFGRHLRALGLVQRVWGGVKVWLMDAASAEALWLLAPHGMRERVRMPRGAAAVLPVKRLPPRPKRRLVWPRTARSIPVCDTEGRVYPSARRAGQVLGVSNLPVQHSCTSDASARGRRFRYLTPAEWAIVPADTREGDVVPALVWRRPPAPRDAYARRPPQPAASSSPASGG